MANEKALWSIKRATTIKVVGLIAATFAGLIVLAGSAFGPQWAIALPMYAEKEKKPCRYCHIFPGGGAERNGMGRIYENNGHSFKKKK